MKIVAKCSALVGLSYKVHVKVYDPAIKPVQWTVILLITLPQIPTSELLVSVAKQADTSQI